MGAGTASWTDISATANYIHDNALAVARMATVLTPTVTNLRANGMFARQVWRWNALSFGAHTEEVDNTSNAFYKDTIATITPLSYHCRADITDQRAASDPESVVAAAALELGSAAAFHVDSAIADQFGTTSWAGTIGSGLASTISWNAVLSAHALLMNQGVPTGAPVYCALHPYQWSVLLKAATIAGATVGVAPAFQDRMQVANYYNIPQAHGITFVVTNAIDVTGTAAYGLLYVPRAIAVDTRKPFSIEPERDASKQATEFNASMWYVADQYDPNAGICLYHNAATPT